MSDGSWSGKDRGISLPSSVSHLGPVMPLALVPLMLRLPIVSPVISKASSCRGSLGKWISRVQASCLCEALSQIFWYFWTFLHRIRPIKSNCIWVGFVCRCLIARLLCSRVGRWRGCYRWYRFYSHCIKVGARLLSDRDRYRFGWRNHAYQYTAKLTRSLSALGFYNDLAIW